MHLPRRSSYRQGGSVPPQPLTEHPLKTRKSLFFKWIKQHLRIKAFYGISENAVKTQIWIAVSIYVLVAIARKRLGLEKSLYQILQIFSITSLEKVPILQVFEAFDSQPELLDNSNQLILFGL